MEQRNLRLQNINLSWSFILVYNCSFSSLHRYSSTLPYDLKIQEHFKWQTQGNYQL